MRRFCFGASFFKNRLVQKLETTLKDVGKRGEGESFFLLLWAMKGESVYPRGSEMELIL